MFREKKPYSAVTVQIDRLTSEQFEEDDYSGVYDLVEVIRIQSSGPTEAARAIRKKLKYGNPHRQIRALVLLDGLMQNAGSGFLRTFADEPLLERLRLLPRDEVTDAKVRQKCKVLFVQWANAYKNTVGLERIANLYKELPKSHRPHAARQKVLQDTGDFDSDREPPQVTSAGARSRASSSVGAVPNPSSSRPVSLTPTQSSTLSKLSKSKKSSSSKQFSLSKEKENMTNAIAQASIASTNLLNGLQLINRETELVSENPEVVRRFETCKNLRRRILYYIQHVESDDWIGSLVNANDELVKALTAYEITDRSIDDDSDSDAWENSGNVTPHTVSGPSVDTQKQLAGLSLQETPPVKPPRPSGVKMPAKPTFANQVPPSRPNEDEDEWDKISIQNALRKSNVELESEERILDWQKRTDGGFAAETEERLEINANLPATPRVRSVQEPSQSSHHSPLTQKNLDAVHAAGTNAGAQTKYGKSKAAASCLKKGAKGAVIPILKTCTSIMSFQRRCENFVWGTLEAKHGKGNTLRKKEKNRHPGDHQQPRLNEPSSDGPAASEEALRESRFEFAHLELAHRLNTQSAQRSSTPLRRTTAQPSNLDGAPTPRHGLSREDLERLSTRSSSPTLSPHISDPSRSKESPPQDALIVAT